MYWMMITVPPGGPSLVTCTARASCACPGSCCPYMVLTEWDPTHWTQNSFLAWSVALKNIAISFGEIVESEAQQIYLHCRSRWWPAVGDQWTDRRAPALGSAWRGSCRSVPCSAMYHCANCARNNSSPWVYIKWRMKNRLTLIHRFLAINRFICTDGGCILLP